jgi:hypothetical protein
MCLGCSIPSHTAANPCVPLLVVMHCSTDTTGTPSHLVSHMRGALQSGTHPLRQAA